MNITDTIILGIVEGATEFLPVSSTGHLILANHLLGQSGEVQATFDIFIQLGAILAVVFLYHHRFKMLFQFQGGTGGFSGLKGWGYLIATSLPALILGLLFHDDIKDKLFNPFTVTMALGVGGLALIAFEQLRLKVSSINLDAMTMRQAVLVGLFQCLALWPGVSRSASTIIGGMVAGVDRRAAAEYSFIAAVPIMCVVTVYDLAKSFHQLSASDLQMFALGFVVSFISAIIAVKFFVSLLQRTTLVPFGIYRMILAGLFYWHLQGGL